MLFPGSPGQVPVGESPKFSLVTPLVATSLANRGAESIVAQHIVPSYL